MHFQESLPMNRRQRQQGQAHIPLWTTEPRQGWASENGKAEEGSLGIPSLALTTAPLLLLLALFMAPFTPQGLSLLSRPHLYPLYALCIKYRTLNSPEPLRHLCLP